MTTAGWVTIGILVWIGAVLWGVPFALEGLTMSEWTLLWIGLCTWPFVCAIIWVWTCND